MSLTWKDQLAPAIRQDWAAEIDNFEAQMLLRKQNKVEEKVFAELRLRRGAYGQRYDNGRRHDGVKTQDLIYPQTGLTKGPDTIWDAPGMQRIKIPGGQLNSTQLMVLADLADEYSDSILHVTTRQDFQLHYIHIEDTPDIMRRLAAVGITTKEACGNSVRNVTACPLAGVCHTEAFDVTPYSKQMMLFMLGHPDTLDFGRKFKIAFSGCRHEACALVSIHDLGLIAVKKIENGKEVRGFDVYVGGGLGAVPFQAKLLSEFVPINEILPTAQAISRVFARLGEKKNRQKARLKFVVQKLGIDEFRKLVAEERKTLPYDPRWDQYGKDLEVEAAPSTPSPGTPGEGRVRAGSVIQSALALGTMPSPQPSPGVPGEGEKRTPCPPAEWLQTNIYPQRQPGYLTATVTLPLGDLATHQARKLAAIADRYAGGHLRSTIEQNLVLRWVSESDLPSLYSELAAIGLNEPGAGTIVDVTSCPGTDTCKLGIASSRGLAGELRDRLALQSATLDESVKGLRIKISGCFNSCGQHHVADIGFYGNSRNINGYTVPHFQVMLGGKFKENAASYGQAIGSIPSKAIPQAVERLLGRYVKDRATKTESFHEFCARLGKKELKTMLEDLTNVPPYVMDPTFYSDWGDPREFTIGDMGTGECAGEVVSLVQFGFTAAESEAFEAQLKLEAGDFHAADQFAYKAMLDAAKTLVKIQFRDVPDRPDAIVNEFKTRYVEPKIFWDKYHAAQFANYLIGRFENPPAGPVNQDWAHRLVDEANLFIDAAHSCHAKIQQQAAALPTA